MEASPHVHEELILWKLPSYQEQSTNLCISMKILGTFLKDREKNNNLEIHTEAQKTKDSQSNPEQRQYCRRDDPT